MSYVSYLSGFSPAERCALHLDGIITRNGEFLDVAETPHSRALRTLGDLNDRLVLTGFSAAWALGACAEPRRHAASYRRCRTHVPDKIDFVIEQRHLTESDLCGFFTTPLRTTIDLLRSNAPDDEVLTTISRLMNQHLIEPHIIHDVLESSLRLPYRHRALNRLRLLANLPAG